MRFLRRVGVAFAFAATLLGSAAPATAQPPTSSDVTIIHQRDWYLADYQNYWSKDLRTRLAWQKDGNLVVYVDSKDKWDSKTPGRGFLLRFQEDGHLVVYESNFRPIFQTGTYPFPYAIILVQNDGNVVMYKDAARQQVLWSTGTYRR